MAEITAAMVRELRETPWREPLPETQVKAIAAAEARVRRTLARQALSEIASELHEAYAAFDVDRGNELRERWVRYSQIARLDPDEPSLNLSAPLRFSVRIEVTLQTGKQLLRDLGPLLFRQCQCSFQDLCGGATHVIRIALCGSGWRCRQVAR